MPTQIPLQVSLRDGATFASFFGQGNPQAVHALREMSALHGERFLYLWGAPGVGKTHLLQAVCHEGAEKRHAVAYLPLRKSAAIATGYLEGLERLDLVCIDDVQAIAGGADWEQALFHFHNNLREQHGRLIVAANVAPAGLNLSLPDLRSRLSWGPVFQIRALDDAAKIGALQLRARIRGFELPDEVAGYLIRRCPRDMPALFNLLERLDHASLAAKRKLTIPFVRERIAELDLPCDT